MRTLACALMLTSLAAAVPQGGYTKEKHPELGLELPRARDYEAIPLQPDEAWKLLYWAEKQSKTDKQRRGARPTLFIVRIDWVDDPAPVPAAAPEKPWRRVHSTANRPTPFAALRSQRTFSESERTQTATSSS